jgi:DNA-binding CsgD family transcriptional regulator
MRPSHYRTRPRIDLTPRQRQVAELLARGKTNPEIADVLGISLDGAKFHVSEILDRLGVGTREEAAAWWRERQSPRSRLARAFAAPLVRWAAIGAAAAAVGATVAVVVATGLLPGGNSKAGTSAQPTKSTQSGAVATATKATIAASQPCAIGRLIAQLRGEGATGMLFVGLRLYARTPCRLQGSLSVTATAQDPLPGSPMTIPVDATVEGEVSIPLASITPSLCIPPSTVISVALNGLALTSWTLSPDAGSSCQPGTGAATLTIGPQQRGPGGTPIVEPISSPPRVCDLTSAQLLVHTMAHDDAHGGESVMAGLSGFSTPCQLIAGAATIALVDASGEPVTVVGNPALVAIIADPQGPADLQAGASLQWDNWCGSSQVYARLTIDGRDFEAPILAGPDCTDPAAPSRLELEARP